MVITVSEYNGKFHCNGHIFVPYNWYNAQNCPVKISQCQPVNNYIKFYSNKQHKNSNNNELQKKPKLETINKYISYERSENNHNTEKNDLRQKEELWTKQFSRWWGWNWRRKRKLLLSKFGMCQKNIMSTVSSKYQKEEGQKKIDNYEEAGEHKRFTHKVNSLQKKNLGNSMIGQLHQPLQFTYKENILNHAELYTPIPPICSNQLAEPCKSRRNKNKKNERIYEGWMRKIQSSDSNCTNINDAIKINKQKKTTNNEKLHYLSLRLRKLNSNELILREKKKVDNEGKKLNSHSNISILDENMKINHKYNKSEIKSKHANTDQNNYKKSKMNYPSNGDYKKPITEYVSPITGKYYDASLHKVLYIANETNEADKLNSVTVTDSNFIPTREYNWMRNFQLMKGEHKNFLNSINKAMSDLKNINSIKKYKCSKVCDFNEISNLRSEESIKAKYYENDGFSNENGIKISLPSIVETETTNDENLISNICPVKSKAIETIYVKQIQDLNCSLTNLHDFYFENNIVQDTIHSADYDLNYIRNHIDCFASIITDTSFIVNR